MAVTGGSLRASSPLRGAHVGICLATNLAVLFTALQSHPSGKVVQRIRLQTQVKEDEGAGGARQSWSFVLGVSCT